MKRKERHQLTKDFIHGLRRDLKALPQEGRLALFYLLAFLSVITAIIFLVWLF